MGGEAEVHGRSRWFPEGVSAPERIANFIIVANRLSLLVYHDPSKAASGCIRKVSFLVPPSINTISIIRKSLLSVISPCISYMEVEENLT